MTIGTERRLDRIEERPGERVAPLRSRSARGIWGAPERSQASAQEAR